MRVLHRWSLAKYETEAHLNEDASACSPRRGTFAISDGASESFSSGTWARLLVARFVRRPKLDANWMNQAAQSYSKAFDRGAMSWSAQAAFDRGSFATLLGLSVDEGGVSIAAIGDSLAVLDDGSAPKATFPYRTSEQFRANPLLLSTLPDRNASVLIANHEMRWTYEGIDAPKLFCMTDALGAWLLSDLGNHMRILRSLSVRRDFVALVERARAEGLMRRDDSTLLVLG